MRRFLFALSLVTLAVPALAEDILPDRRVVVSRDIDFFGSDLQALFDTSLEACQRICLSDSACAAFTFNSRSNACFPKTSVSERQAYEGAISAIVVPTDPEVMARAEPRAGDLAFLPRADLDAALAQAEGLGQRHMGGKWTVEVLLTAAREKEAEGDLGNALHWTGAALAQSDAADLWVEYARLALAIGAAADRSSEQRQLADSAVAAGVNGYLRAPAEADRVAALLVLAEALQSIPRFAAEQTLLAYISDHGDYMGSHGLSMKKSHPHEESVRVPAIFHWPGAIPESGAVDGLFVELDNTDPDRFVMIPLDGLSMRTDGDDKDVQTGMTAQDLAALPDAERPSAM